MDPTTSDELLRHLGGARWFAGKGRRAEVASLTPLPWLTDVAAWPAVRAEIVRVDYPPAEDPEPASDAEPGWPYELYQLVVSYRQAPVPGLQHAEIGRRVVPDLGAVIAYDATADPEASSLIWRLLLAGARVRDRDGEVSFHRTRVDGLDPAAPPAPFTGQQSNTSVMFGDQAMIKFFRRIEFGGNLDIEVHDGLARAGVDDVARLYGWATGRWVQDGFPVEADLAMAVEKLANAADGWGLALDSLRAEQDFADDAAALGRALAHVHDALRRAFPTAVADAEATEAIMRSRLAAAAQAAPALFDLVPGIEAAFARLGDGTLSIQRVHGDFHLGQTLKTPAGWKIIDFEGEPAKTMAERIALDSPWRDVAGMLRSFDYAAATVPGPGAARWLARAREAFLTAYADGPSGGTHAGQGSGGTHAGQGSGGTHAGPGLSDHQRAILRAYEADKAIYELVYEMRNRPDWTAIPLGAVRTLAHDQSAQDQSTEGEHDGIRPRR